MQRIIIAFLLLSSVLQVHAQEAPLPANPGNPPLKWEVGADMLWLIKKKPAESNVWLLRRYPTPYTAILRIHQNSGSAYRLRLGGYYHELLNPRSTLSGTSGSIAEMVKTEANLFAAFGKEWEKRYSKFRFFYGSDLFVDYSLDSFERNIYQRNEFLGSVRNVSAGLSPLVGVQYFVHPRLSFSTESHLNVAYHKYKAARLEGGDSNLPLMIDKYDFVKAHFQPFSSVNLHYHF